WNEGIDVFLLFTGLFSGILSAFLITSFSALQPDNTQATVDGLVALSQQLALMSGGQPIDLSTIYQPPSFYIPWTALVVNGLWFVSLFLSLLAAVLAMLSKEWLSAYNDKVESIPLERVQQRQFRYMGLKKWLVPSIISFLPLSIHVAVFLFFTGAVIFVWTVSILLAALLAALLLVGLSLYVISAVLPLIKADCPYKSP
ncbi:hypothetical protein CALVIDRAFT_472004, partial [Calocera viscosa TUFC12733]